MPNFFNLLFLFFGRTRSFIVLSYSVLISSIVYLVYFYIKKSEEILDLKNKCEIIRLHNQSLEQSLKQSSEFAKSTSEIVSLPAYSAYTDPVVIFGVVVGVIGLCIIIYLYCNGGGAFPTGGGGDSPCGVTPGSPPAGSPISSVDSNTNLQLDIPEVSVSTDLPDLESYTPTTSDEVYGIYEIDCLKVSTNLPNLESYTPTEIIEIDCLKVLPDLPNTPAGSTLYEVDYLKVFNSVIDFYANNLQYSSNSLTKIVENVVLAEYAINNSIINIPIQLSDIVQVALTA